MLTLNNIKHVPELRLNLISIGKLDDDGFCSIFFDGQWKLAKVYLTVARGTKYSSLYLMQARVTDRSINAVESESKIELWHSRLSHISEKGLMVLAKKNLISKRKNKSLKKCAHSLFGRKTNRSCF